MINLMQALGIEKLPETTTEAPLFNWRVPVDEDYCLPFVCESCDKHSFDSDEISEMSDGVTLCLDCREDAKPAGWVH